ncbi:HAD family hydrolase [Actibacterium sp. 188UL27-1]|uniref:HAD family hydrolase n=1 Tax=Actibacterium sp. 188UL27-1 TaxID=2786961 RepID=UPI00195DE19A|nr:HAD-IA family hydrolase [Actibacterium sp. 188UL27-1]MBM7070264.1 HAD-IA family hydrolase [Actibacterium sp. 188UL27-1]
MPKVIAWDFDGVLNNNMVDGQFLWSRTFEADLGQSLDAFTQFVFRDRFDLIITGQEDLHDRLTRWADSVGYDGGADGVLRYWLSKDALPDPAMLDLMDRATAQGLRQVIATNNETRRAAYMEMDMGFGARIEHLFASGRMGVKKPDPAFFHHITQTLDVSPADMLLIDDHPPNVQSAQELGWQAFLFTGSEYDQLASLITPA